jgi:hypothetical protein
MDFSVVMPHSMLTSSSVEQALWNHVVIRFALAEPDPEHAPEPALFTAQAPTVQAGFFDTL